ncbi:hypothetical protein TPHA_0D03600 [Tetrapisispora phaffii CBS 4417]|uniref:DNA 3'-5' helicase n=1 Tax=Tetrapisispora phaffii (strain ATCC 24235 / CBS 4417 / NBRC 1672 / NRRL Y-8282 / UCD 70-5) TaxID=1071381 RepID=G8BT24_TETPH|nr:hypothetical protein TPHA_0D03600 [Tetrapisispora phaffii CBS 4417]CCE62995.1 hypothetical protein TPHA_0D03600 [Tetrapisispora phaffii CBS 4417]
MLNKPQNTLNKEYAWLKKNEDSVYETQSTYNIITGVLNNFDDVKVNEKKKPALGLSNPSNLQEIINIQSIIIGLFEERDRMLSYKCDILGSTSLSPESKKFKILNEIQTKLLNLKNEIAEYQEILSNLKVIKNNDVPKLAAPDMNTQLCKEDIIKEEHIHVSSNEITEDVKKDQDQKLDCDENFVDEDSQYSADTTTIYSDEEKMLMNGINITTATSVNQTDAAPIINDVIIGSNTVVQLNSNHGKMPEYKSTITSNNKRTLRFKNTINYKIPDADDPFDYVMAASKPLKYSTITSGSIEKDEPDDYEKNYLATQNMNNTEDSVHDSDLEFVDGSYYNTSHDFDYKESEHTVDNDDDEIIEASDADISVHENSHLPIIKESIILLSPSKTAYEGNISNENVPIINVSDEDLNQDLIIEDSNLSAFSYNLIDQFSDVEMVESGSEKIHNTGDSETEELPISQKELDREIFDLERENFSQKNNLKHIEDELQVISETCMSNEVTTTMVAKEHSINIESNINDRSDAALSFPWSSEVLFRLKNSFNLNSFRPNQLEAINSTLNGRDVFVLMPTGGGKSLCYQLPAIVKSGKTSGTTIVISPLISLMHDQVEHLLNINIKASMISSKSPAAQRKKTFNLFINGLLDLVYISPEMMSASQQCKRAIKRLYETNKLARIVVDEAHCVSNWGHDFRPDYKELKLFKREYPTIPLIALTATANEQVQLDIINNLGVRNPLLLKQSFNRTNLDYIIRTKSKNTVNEICSSLKTDFKNQSGIIYCNSKISCEQVAQQIASQKIRTAFYHAGMTPSERLKIQKAWQNNQVQVICATVAFGMGIDKPDVRFVIHFTIPRTLEGYYQETGRAGRDGLPAQCITYFSFKDVRSLQTMIQRDKSLNKENKLKHLEKLQQVVSYCDNVTTCRRQQVLKYFNEDIDPSVCLKQCDNCRNSGNFSIEERDVTNEAKMIINLIGTLKDERVTRIYCQDIFKGSRSAKILQSGHNLIKDHAAGKHLSKLEIERIFSQLVTLRLLEEYPIVNASGFASHYIKLGIAAKKFLKDNTTLKMEFIINNSSSRPNSNRSSSRTLITTNLNVTGIERHQSDLQENNMIKKTTISTESNSIQDQPYLNSAYKKLKELSLSLGQHVNPPTTEFLSEDILKKLAKELPKDEPSFKILVNNDPSYNQKFKYFKDTIMVLRSNFGLLNKAKKTNTVTSSSALIIPHSHNFELEFSESSLNSEIIRQIRDTQDVDSQTNEESLLNSKGKKKRKSTFSKGSRKYKSYKRFKKK